MFKCLDILGEPNEASNKRTSSQAWLSETEGLRETESVAERIHKATRMFTTERSLGGEQFQVILTLLGIVNFACRRMCDF